MKRTQLVIAGVAVLAVVVIAAVVTLSPRAPVRATAGTAAPSVALAVARAGTFVRRVELQGRIGAPAGNSAKVSFAQAGMLRMIDVAIGQHVSAGQPLAELDRSALSASLAAAQADTQAAGSVQSANARAAVTHLKLTGLERGGPAALSSRIAAESAVRQATLKTEADRSEVARDDTLLAAGVVAGKDVDAARAQLASDQAAQRTAIAAAAAARVDFRSALEQARADAASAAGDVQTALAQRAAAQARLNVARIAYDNGVIIAPTDGTILAILKHPGEAVDPSVPVIEVGTRQTTIVTLTAPAAIAQQIRLGARVSVRVAIGQAAEGTVIAVVPAVDPAAQLTTILVSGVPPGAVGGDAVNATLAVGRIGGVLVPSSAIVEDPQSGKTVVFVHVLHAKAGDSPFASRAVTVRDSDSTTAVVTAGLNGGENVAAQGSYLLLAPAGG